MRVKYKNELYHIISENGLEPRDFEITEITEHELPTTLLTYKKTQFKFIIRNSHQSYELFDYQFTLYGPEFSLSGIYPNDEFTYFETVANEFEEWINENIHKYIEDQNEVDLWQQLKSGNRTLDIDNIDFNNKDDFKRDEKKQINLAMNELKLLIQRNFHINDSELEIINDRLNYLVDATDRLNKYDWKSLVISTLISISIALSLDTEKGKLLFELFRKVFIQIKEVGH